MCKARSRVAPCSYLVHALEPVKLIVREQMPDVIRPYCEVRVPYRDRDRYLDPALQRRVHQGAAAGGTEPLAVREDHGDGTARLQEQSENAARQS